jgi:hypothetical protein
LKNLNDNKEPPRAKLREPDTFTGQDPQKLRTFLMQCRFQFRDRPAAFKDDMQKVNFALSYLRGQAFQWFEPGFSGRLHVPPLWLDNWDEFVQELETNFGPYDDIGDAENELATIKMLTGQRISEYIVRFNSLASRCDWGDAPLRHRFYNGLPNRLKDEVSRGDGKPKTLHLLRLKAQNADARYWERKAEMAQENNSAKPEKNNDKSSSNNNSNNASSSNSNSNNNSGKKNDKKSDNKGQKQQNSGKQQQASGSTPKNDLSTKLDSNGKLTQQERQRRIDGNLCLFCGKGGHKVSECRLKDSNSSKARAATTTSADPESKEKKPAEPKKE